MNPNSITSNHIFIIEDDVLMQYVLKRTFSGVCLVTVFSNGQAAFTAIQSGVVPDLIITDLHTPLLNGIQLLSKIKADAGLAHIPVLIMSADNSSDIKQYSLSAGADGYLVKPFEMQDLLSRTNHLINAGSRLGSLLHA